MAIGQLWETLTASIVTYTGVSPTVFFTVLAVAAAFYYVLSGIFSSTTQPHHPRNFEEIKPLPPPVQLGEITAEELKQYDGSDPKKPLLMAIKGQIYDVSQSRMFYGPGGPYALFAGKDASRALAKMSFEEKDLTGDVSDLGAFERDALQDWEYKFMSKYVKVGTVKKPETGTVESTATSSRVTEAEPVAEDAVDGHVEPREVGSSVEPSKEPAKEVCSTNDDEDHTTKIGDSTFPSVEHIDPELAKEVEISKD